MRREGNCTSPVNPVIEYVQHHNWPFLARLWISFSFLLPGPSRPQGTAGHSSNSEGAGHSGFHWAGCIVDKETRSSVAHAMED
jgi:hypothetical protein